MATLIVCFWLWRQQASMTTRPKDGSRLVISEKQQPVARKKNFKNFKHVLTSINSCELGRYRMSLLIIFSVGSTNWSGIRCATSPNISVNWKIKINYQWSVINNDENFSNSLDSITRFRINDYSVYGFVFGESYCLSFIYIFVSLLREKCVVLY